MGDRKRDASLCPKKEEKLNQKAIDQYVRPVKGRPESTGRL